jgi:hypothetical protein
MEIASAIAFVAVSTTTLAIGLGLGYVVLSSILALMQRGMNPPVDPEGASAQVIRMQPREAAAYEPVDLLEAA